MSERKPMSTVIARSTDVFDSKVIVNEDKDKLKRKVKNIRKFVDLKIMEFKSGDEAFAEYSKFLMNGVIRSREELLISKGMNAD